MKTTIGIRRENKNDWERRVPLTPIDLAGLQERYPIEVLVQSSPIRIFSDDEYRKAGIKIEEDLESASIVFAVKEIPPQLLKPGRVYVFFAHVIKGQSYNMSMLRRLMDLKCTLIDYERILDDQGRRLIFFGVHAGFAGMIETLRSLGQRLASKGFSSPFIDVRHAYEYEGLDQARDHLREIGRRIEQGELPESLRPLVFGVAGYGNVSRGAQELLDCLSVKTIAPADLPRASSRDGGNRANLLKVVFKEEDMARPIHPDTEFELMDYYRHPEKYEGRFSDYLPYIDVLVNTAYWDERYPRLVTKLWAKENYRAGQETRLQVIGDVSCDIEGGIEITLHSTDPGSPSYVYDPTGDTAHPGHEGIGPVIMAVDNLPCELSRESSEFFSAVLREMVGPLAEADWTADYTNLAIPASLKGAVIVHRGELTPDYKHLETHLAS